MRELVWLLPALPFAGFVVLLLAGARLPRRAVAAVGAGSVGAAALVALAILVEWIGSPPAGSRVTQVLWSWIDAGSFRPEIALTLDPLALVMVLVVTVVGFLIHL